MTGWVQNGESRGAWSIQRHLKILTLAGMAFLSLTACHKSGESDYPAITLEHEIAPQPPRVGPVTITLKLTDSSGRALSGAAIDLEGNMSHAGMAPVFARATENRPGSYQAALEFSMGGDWIVLVHITLKDGQKLERQFAVNGVRSN